MMLHGAQSPSVTSISTMPGASATAAATTVTPHDFNPARRMRRKRKAESQDNERLSKRLSLLNLEQGGSKLYVPVETPSVDANAPTTRDASKPKNTVLDDSMQVDDSKHKVYIYNIDDELSSDSESEEGKLVFLPDIEKHLKANRIPPSILANDEGELAGMQLVLYNDPKSLTVPEEKDSVRKAIIESRHRVREQQRLQREGKWTSPNADNESTKQDDMNGTSPVHQSHDYDPDVMDID